MATQSVADPEQTLLVTQTPSSLSEGCPILKSVTCQGNPGHAKFTPVRSLEPDHIPEKFRSRPLAEIIRQKAELTVRLTIHSASTQRPQEFALGAAKNTTRISSGTVFIADMGKKQRCPLEKCSVKPGSHDTSGFFKVMTSAHAVYDDTEAQATTVEFFLDDDRDRGTVARGQGIKVTSLDNKRSILQCVTHDLEIYPKLQHFLSRKDQLLTELVKQAVAKPRGSPSSSSGSSSSSSSSSSSNSSNSRPPKTISQPEELLVALISHPHGAVKHVSFGKLLASPLIGEEVFKVKDMSLRACTLVYDAPSCPSSGGGSVIVFDSSGNCVGFAPHFGSSGTRNSSGMGWVLEIYAYAYRME